MSETPEPIAYTNPGPSSYWQLEFCWTGERPTADEYNVWLATGGWNEYVEVARRDFTIVRFPGQVVSEEHYNLLAALRFIRLTDRQVYFFAFSGRTNWFWNFHGEAPHQRIIQEFLSLEVDHKGQVMGNIGWTLEMLLWPSAERS